MEHLTPIDEEPAEDNDEMDDQPITMIPKIMHTAPSPTTDMYIPPNSNVTSTTTVNNDQTPRHHYQNIPSAASIIEATVENETKNGSRDKEVSQIESVL